MPVLKNPKWELFAQELAKGTTADEAYQLAGYKPNRGNAATLKQNQSILDRVNALLAEREKMHGQSTSKAIERAALTKEWVITRLMDNALVALGEVPVRVSQEEGKPAVEEFAREAPAANRALELLGKELGMFVDRREIGKPGQFSQMSEHELDDFIAQRKAALGGSIGGEGTSPVQKEVRKSSRVH